MEVDGDTGEAGASRVPIYFVIFLQWTTEAAPTEAPAAAEQLSAAQVEMRGKTERKVASRGTSVLRGKRSTLYHSIILSDELGQARISYLPRGNRSTQYIMSTVKSFMVLWYGCIARIELIIKQ